MVPAGSVAAPPLVAWRRPHGRGAAPVRVPVRTRVVPVGSGTWCRLSSSLPGGSLRTAVPGSFKVRVSPPTAGVVAGGLVVAAGSLTASSLPGCLVPMRLVPGALMIGRLRGRSRADVTAGQPGRAEECRVNVHANRPLTVPSGSPGQDAARNGTSRGGRDAQGFDDVGVAERRGRVGAPDAHVSVVAGGEVPADWPVRCLEPPRDAGRFRHAAGPYAGGWGWFRNPGLLFAASRRPGVPGSCMVPGRMTVAGVLFRRCARNRFVPDGTARFRARSCVPGSFTVRVHSRGAGANMTGWWWGARRPSHSRPWEARTKDELPSVALLLAIPLTRAAPRYKAPLEAKFSEKRNFLGRLTPGPCGPLRWDLGGAQYSPTGAIAIAGRSRANRYGPIEGGRSGGSRS